MTFFSFFFAALGRPFGVPAFCTGPLALTTMQPTSAHARPPSRTSRRRTLPHIFRVEKKAGAAADVRGAASIVNVNPTGGGGGEVVGPWEATIS